MTQVKSDQSPFSFDLNISQNKKRMASYMSKLNSHKSENREIMSEITSIRNELYKITEPAFHIGEVIRRMGDDTYLVKISTEGKYIVKVKQALMNMIKEDKVKLPRAKKTLKVIQAKENDKKSQEKAFKEGGIAPGTRVALNNDSYMIERILPTKVDPLISLMKVEKVPDASYDLIGGLDEQIKKVCEVIELPIKRPDLFESLGIVQPKGVLLYGPPGTGKTLVARAVAHHTDCTFIKVSGGELVQKYIGEGTRLVRELFIMAREHAPSIIFMDEIDSIGTKRVGGGKGSGDSEVQRTMLELLNQLDGFEASKNIKVIMATNRIDILDQALLRPGRIDRKIEFPKPKNEARLPIFKIHTKKMNLSENVNLEQVAENAEGASGADIKSICTEAGMFALREKRESIETDDFELATNKVLSKNDLLLGGENELWI